MSSKIDSNFLLCYGGIILKKTIIFKKISKNNVFLKYIYYDTPLSSKIYWRI